MTKFLSQALNAPEPSFRLGLSKLEAANGNPATDIRFSTEILHLTRQKLLELGLDPHDTTPKELYRALEQRLKADDQRLSRKLRTEAATHVSAEADVTAGMVHVLKKLSDTKHCFALKASSLKSLLRRLPPKKAMRALGYRSIESFVKHESPVLILTAAWLTEGATWQKRLLEQYKRLGPSDFESRPVSIVYADSPRWRKLADKLVEIHRHNLVCFKEMGALVFMSLPSHVPEGAVTVSLTLALHELNEIRAASTFLQLHQVRRDFGESVRQVALQEPRLSSQLLDQPMPWNLIQRYYSRLKDHFKAEIFEPHFSLEEMIWQPVEQTLVSIEPSFNFWRQTSHLGFLDGDKPVSLNLVDVALSFCNKLSYETRAVHYFQRSLWQELMLRYLKHGAVESSVLAELQPELAEAA